MRKAAFGGKSWHLTDAELHKTKYIHYIMHISAAIEHFKVDNRICHKDAATERNNASSGRRQ